ncbi:COG4223 family protein [Asticcacaulis benevestitus]|uniref:Inner membrane protein n=1 Tax=Asticcacaulis benevestitus DSM 16100 = ATCC BAA-896 TaxID=1121022 RepID=V4PJI0_9CAUL|nr:mitofilin family membrane protein [Asticcacaulis benevestitus]ESQ94102.1 hypothetical protein ABENE_03155 [Asticcacaulis benevestitus DSM 16100 = ATCC BAA-896]
MSEPLDSTLSGETLDQEFAAEDAHRKDAAKMTRVFLLFAAPLVIMIAIVIAAVAFKMSQDSRAIVATATPAASAPAVAASDPQKDAQIAALQSQIAALQGQLHPAEATAPAQPLYTADPTALSQLSARLDRVEANQQALAKAAASAFAARTLQQAARTEQPFLSELAVVEAGIDDPSLVTALRPYAEKGVPSEVTLAVKFPAVAARANSAVQADDGKDDLFSQLRHALGGFISIRRTDDIKGQGADAILQRAEIRLNNGDLKGAVAYLNTLSPAAQKALSPWIDQARARVLVDDITRHISESALNRLSQTTATDTPLRNGGVL